MVYLVEKTQTVQAVGVTDSSLRTAVAFVKQKPLMARQHLKGQTRLHLGITILAKVALGNVVTVGAETQMAVHAEKILIAIVIGVKELSLLSAVQPVELEETMVSQHIRSQLFHLYGITNLARA